MTTKQEYRIRLEKGSRAKEVILGYAEEGIGAWGMSGRVEACLRSYVAHTMPKWSIASISKL